MDRFAVFVLLQNQYAWPFWKIRIILNDLRESYSLHDLRGEKAVFRQFVVTVV
ncbi:MAG: hypothetical protein L6306_09100 [Planctomycetales bacterium]|nr:hypothetical protein [Planctomycetales bacterium]